MAGRRHPSEEVAEKLGQADEMMADGKTQREITKALGVSIMTLHRWRKTRDHGTTAVKAGQPHIGKAEAKVPRHSDTLITEMRIENDRLRRLLTDLLLEKMKLEEELRQRANIRRKVPER